MNKIQQSSAAIVTVLALSLGACATQPNYSASNTSSGAQAARSSGLGTVQSIELVKQDTRNGIGLGTVAGAVIGGVVGNQIGEGQGRTAATVIGAAGGAYAGNRIEDSRRQAADAYRITLRMDNGEYQSFVQADDAGLRIGDRAWVNNGVVQHY